MGFTKRQILSLTFKEGNMLALAGVLTRDLVSFNGLTDGDVRQRCVAVAEVNGWSVLWCEQMLLR